jgi:diguanylate cyclase (GGDEF)-like protein
MERPPIIGRDDKRHVDLVRRTALLLAANTPARDVYAQICTLLAQFVDAAAILISAIEDGSLRLVYEFGSQTGAAPADARTVAGSAQSLIVKDAVHVPIVFGGQAVGVLSVGTGAGTAYDAADVEALETCAVYLGALMHDEAQHRADRAPHVSLDGLTGLPGRRGFDVALEKERRRCERANAPLSVVVADVDHFKDFNDAYGHVAGDMCLRQIARSGAKCVGRPGDAFARYAGAQFAVILPFTPQDGAVKVAERIREAVYALNIPHQRSSLGRISVSAGVFTAVPARPSIAETFAEEAFTWLRAAKALGRNRVCAPEYESSTRGAESRRFVQHNLPDARTSFVGRSEDIARVRALLQSERIVTLAGAGGTGKTRTAIEAARGIVDRFADGVWFIDLANAGDLQSILIAIASSARLGSAEPEDVVQFAERLRERSLLLILDNCEQVVHECRELVEVLPAHAPQVKLLLTTREPLRLTGERVFRLPMLAQDEAVLLFLDRAQQSGASAGERETVRRIVQRLDGMPLAIELAAARLGVMSLDDLLRALDDCLNVLRTPLQGVPVRQRTLRALFDWSYGLLEQRDRMLFRRLSIFPATWSLEAVEPVTHCDVDALEALITKSLVQRVEIDGRARFRFLNVTREYASTFFDEAGERETVLTSLSEYFCTLAIERGAQLKEMPMREWLALQAPDRENYIVALREVLRAPRDPERAAAMLESMRHWFHERAPADFYELLPFFEGLLAQDGLPENLVAAIALAAADLYGNRDLRRSRECAERALRFYRSVDDGLGAAHALERFASVQRYLEGGVDLQQERALQNGVFSAKRNGDKRLAAMLLRVLSDIYMNKPDREREREVLLEAYEMLRQSGDDDRGGGVLGRLAVAEFWSGDYEQARSTCRAAITLLEHAGEPWTLAFQLMNLGLFETFRDDVTAARVALQKSMELLPRYGHQYAMANIFFCYGILANRVGQHERAARLLAHSDGLFAAGPRQQVHLQHLHDEVAAELLARLGAERFERNSRAGRSMSSTQTLQETAQV